MEKLVWIFCPEMTLAQIPEFGFFVQNSRIGVKGVRYDLETHLRVIKISELTIVGLLRSKIKSSNRYNFDRIKTTG